MIQRVGSTNCSATRKLLQSLNETRIIYMCKNLGTNHLILWWVREDFSEKLFSRTDFCQKEIIQNEGKCYNMLCKKNYKKTGSRW